MSHKKSQDAAYLRVQGAIFSRLSGVSVRETAKITKKARTGQQGGQVLKIFYGGRSGRPTVLDRTAKKIIEKAKNKRGSSTRPEQRSSWICSNSVEIYIQQRMETLETKNATTFEQQTAGSSLGIRSQISLSYSR